MNMRIASRRRSLRLGGSPPVTSDTGYPWQDGDILYAADLNAAFLPIEGGTVTGPVTFTSLEGTAFQASAGQLVNFQSGGAGMGWNFGYNPDYGNVLSVQTNTGGNAGDGITGSAVVPAANGGSYLLGEDVIDGLGGKYTITAINSSNGITGLTVVNRPYSALPPANPVTLIGGHGAGAAVNITWTATNTLSLQPSGGALVLANLPTSSTGLVAGQVWRNGTVLNIV